MKIVLSHHLERFISLLYQMNQAPPDTINMPLEKEMFSVTSDSVLQQAAASGRVVYSGSLRFRRDGRIVAERGNNPILHSSEGRFTGVQQSHGWVKLILTKKQE